MVGFAKSEVLCYPPHQNKGFQRYIYIYTKSTMFPSERVECPPTPFVCSGSTKDQERTDPLENCSSFRLEEEEPISSLRSGSSNSGFVVNGDDCDGGEQGQEQEEVYVNGNGNGCGSGSSLRDADSGQDNGENSSPSRAESRVSGPMPEDEDSRISGPAPVEEVEQNGVHVNGVGSSPNHPVENGVVENGEEENLSGDNT